MNQVVFMSYFLNSLSMRGTPTSPANIPLVISFGESSPPYDPSLRRSVSRCGGAPKRWRGSPAADGVDVHADRAEGPLGSLGWSSSGRHGFERAERGQETPITIDDN